MTCAIKKMKQASRHSWPCGAYGEAALSGVPGRESPEGKGHVELLMKEFVMKASRKKTTPSQKRAGSTSRTTDIKYKALFEQSPYGVLIIDTRGKILDFNEEAHRQLGYSRKEFKGLSIADIDPFQSPEEIRQSVEEVLKKGTAEFAVRHRTKEGETRDVHVITRALALSGETVFHTIWRDITDQKRAEEAVRQSEEKFQALSGTGDGFDMVYRRLVELLATVPHRVRQAIGRHE